MNEPESNAVRGGRAARRVGSWAPKSQEDLLTRAIRNACSTEAVFRCTYPACSCRSFPRMALNLLKFVRENDA